MPPWPSSARRSASTGNVRRVHAGQNRPWLRPPPRRRARYTSSSILARNDSDSASSPPTFPAEALGGCLPEGFQVGLVVGPHDRGHLEMATGAGPVALAEQAHPEPEVGVVVDRVELEHLLELPPGSLHPPR